MYQYELYPERRDDALIPAPVLYNPGAAFAPAARKWQGIPGIERTASGRLFTTYYSGGEGEGPGNFVALNFSGDGGATWQLHLVVQPEFPVRAYDSCLWIDPLGRLWLFWAQSYGGYDGRCGVWCIRCDDPDAASPLFSPPRRVADGVMMNKPTVTSKGVWLFPTAVWACMTSPLNHLPRLRYSSVTASYDQGESFLYLGGADVPNRCFDEHMILERSNDVLWMLVRRYDGVGQSFSYDGGRTWTPGEKTAIPGPNSRFFIRTLQSGRILLVTHARGEGASDSTFPRRNNLTAYISGDEGNTWQGGLLIDARDNVSYPDGVQADDGTIYLVHDREREKQAEIIITCFTEQDVLEGNAAAMRQFVAESLR